MLNLQKPVSVVYITPDIFLQQRNPANRDQVREILNTVRSQGVPSYITFRQALIDKGQEGAVDRYLPELKHPQPESQGKNYREVIKSSRSIDFLKNLDDPGELMMHSIKYIVNYGPLTKKLSFFIYISL